MTQLVKNSLSLRETWVRSLGWEDPLEKGTATHSSILAWRIPWGRKESDTTEQLHFHMVSRDGILLLSRSVLPMAVSIVFKEASEKSEFESQHCHLITVCVIYLHTK